MIDPIGTVEPFFRNKTLVFIQTFAVSMGWSKCRLPWDEWPPLRPASEASWRFREKLRFSSGTLRPPLRAISRCFSASMDAKPRFEVLTFFRMILPLIIYVPLTVKSDDGSMTPRTTQIW
jgi:hypothetical protein